MYSDPVGENFKRAGDWVRENTPEDALVLCSNPNPATLYFANRIGWTCWYERQGEIKFKGETIAMARQRGCKVIVVPDGDKLDDTYFVHYRRTRDYCYEHYYSARGDNFAVFFMDEAPDLKVPESGKLEFGTLETRKYLRGRWGKNYYAEGLKAWYTDLRYDKTGALRLEFPEGVSRMVVRVSSPVALNQITFSLDGSNLANREFPEAWAQADVVLDIPPELAMPGLHTLKFDVSKQKDELVGMLLWSLELQ
jgi:hypothetical protein